MERRKEWNLQALPFLSSLKYMDYYFDGTDGCKKLMERQKEWNLQALPQSLSSLLCWNYSFDETESFPGEGMLLPPTLTTLHIGYLDGLNHKGLQHLTSLKTLVIYCCSPPHMALEKLVTDDEEGEEGLLPQSLTTLELRGISNIKSLSPIHRLTSLISLSISGMNLKSQISSNRISEEVALPSTITFLQLELMEMKSLDGWGLQRLTSLEEMRIRNCDNIEYITTQKEPLPTSLKVIELEWCPRIRSIQRGEAFPSSLEELRIGYCDNIEYITTREEPLPSSLRVIELKWCSRLSSIQRGEAAIPSSLQSLLNVVKCPLLEEKYQSELNRYV